jgi:hypothetical protein
MFSLVNSEACFNHERAEQAEIDQAQLAETLERAQIYAEANLQRLAGYCGREITEEKDHARDGGNSC